MREHLVILAHPASDPLRLPIESWSLAALGVTFVIAAAALTRQQEAPPESPSLFAPRTTWEWALRALAAGVLLGGIVIARVGSPFELENPAPVFLAAFLWPLLALLCFVWPTTWDRVDPFDTLARIFEPGDEDGPARVDSVHIAALPAGAWAWYMSVNTQPLDPGSFGLFLGGYTIAMLAGSLAWGRPWLRRAEAIGAFYRTVGMARRTRIENLPEGALLLLGVVTGGLLFGVVRLTGLWGELNISPQATLWATFGLIACCAVVVGALYAGVRIGGSVVVAVCVMAPFAVAVVIAVAMLRNRLLVVAQLLPRLLLDPLDAGWDPLGQDDFVIDPNPLGTTGLVMAQIAILTLGGVLGAVIARRRAGTEANASIGVVSGLLFVSVLLVAGVAFPG
jgi:hypothetical protein